MAKGKPVHRAAGKRRLPPFRPAPKNIPPDELLAAAGRIRSRLSPRIRAILPASILVEILAAILVKCVLRRASWYLRLKAKHAIEEQGAALLSVKRIVGQRAAVLASNGRPLLTSEQILDVTLEIAREGADAEAVIVGRAVDESRALLGEERRAR